MIEFFDDEYRNEDDEQLSKEINFKFKTKDQIKSLSELELESYIDELFVFHRDYGFVFDNLIVTQERKNKVFMMLKKHYEEKCLDCDLNISPNTLGTVVADSYHPHKIDVKSVGFKTPREVFESDKHLRNLIRKDLKIFNGDGSPKSIKTIMRIYSGVQVVSNFRPTAAKLIYKMFLPRGGGKVWDMSAGWGGRLFGALSSSYVKEYHATDPSTKTIEGLNSVIADFDFDKKANLYCQGSETFCKEDYFDLCFTSPPYFNTEMYADEETQSWKLFSTKEAWRVNFLKKTLQNCWNSLHSERFCIINIANVKTYKELVQDTINTALEVGFSYHGQIKYLLSRIPGSGVNKKEVKLKFEPVLIFYKGSKYKQSYYVTNYVNHQSKENEFFL